MEGGEASLAAGMQGPFPVTATASAQVTGEWGFRAETSPITDGIDFSAFGPPSNNGGPWTVSVAKGVPSWAHTVLGSRPGAVVVTGQLGSGRVVWSGLNLPYHVDAYRNGEESRFLTNAIAWASRTTPQQGARSTAHFDGPQQTTVAVDATSRGVLFKESFFDRWHAYVDGREVTVYRAGPGGEIEVAVTPTSVAPPLPPVGAGAAPPPPPPPPPVVVLPPTGLTAPVPCAAPPPVPP